MVMSEKDISKINLRRVTRKMIATILKLYTTEVAHLLGEVRPEKSGA